jgi:RNA-directed DNA polymerase
VSGPKTAVKPFAIPKQMVWDAYKSVKANRGAPGVDEESIEEFEADLRGNLYKLWNRLSSGSYFPPPVRAVEIPKKDGRGTRTLGVPTVADRIAQTVVKMALEPVVEPAFHPDSYGYRPRRSALDAVAACRERCWKVDWVIDLDIKAFFDTVDHDLVLKAVSRHTDQRWILLYVGRWLKAPLQCHDGTVVPRDRGTPQGSAISPLLANLFLHYAFDRWMEREFPKVWFERYCDDVVVHCVSERQARFVKDAIAKRLAGCRLELHPAKTRIVYCKDSNREGSAEHERFDFLGYTFRPRLALSKTGQRFVSFAPAVSGAAKKAMVEPSARGESTGAVTGRSSTSPGHQPGGARVAQLLRALLPLRVESRPEAHQRLPGPVGDGEVPTAAAAASACSGLARRRLSTAAGPVRALASWHATGRLDDRSRVNREVHARF